MRSYPLNENHLVRFLGTDRIHTDKDPVTLIKEIKIK